MKSNGLSLIVVACCVAIVNGRSTTSGQEPASEATIAEEGQAFDFFETKIRPTLVGKCYGCHSAAAEQRGKLKGNLLLDSREALRAGGASGPAVIPGKPARSLLLAALRHESLEMPPEEKLPEGVIRDFETWIAMGAPDPRASAATRATSSS